MLKLILKNSLRTGKKNKDNDICYYCGGLANDGKQHIPMKGFFPENLRNNLITVPSCKKHNTGIQELENEARIYIASTSGAKYAEYIHVKKIQKDLSRKERRKLLNRILDNFDPLSNTFALENPEIILNFIKYIISGLFFHHNNEVLKSEIRIVCNKLSDQFFSYILLKNYLFELRDLIQGEALNKEIFNYKYTTGGKYSYWWCCFYERFETIAIIKNSFNI